MQKLLGVIYFGPLSSFNSAYFYGNLIAGVDLAVRPT